VYQQLAGILQQHLGTKYPHIRIVGDNYNPGGGRVQMAQLLGMVKMMVIAMIMFKFNPWTYFGYEVAGPTPNIVNWALENKIYACMMTFFLCNMVETQLISSGAFEVSVNGELVWSKLELGNPPQPQQLLTLVIEKLKEHAKQVGIDEIDFKAQL
jgi:selT/selW/selH-like putative selenoprotein